MERNIIISEFNYGLPEDRIAKFPLEKREASKLLLYRHGQVSHDRFYNIDDYLPEGSMLVFNNTKVIRARLIFHKTTGARIEIFCLEPYSPADYERAFSAKNCSEWKCIVGNLKKWKTGPLHIDVEIDGEPIRLTAERIENDRSENDNLCVTPADKVKSDIDKNSPVNTTGDNSQIIRFSWNGTLTFGQLLEKLGKIPIPPYLCRESEEVDNTRYQTVYSKFEGSVAAPTAGLHFTPEIISSLKENGHPVSEVTLHVGAGTFLPVKTDNAAEHKMHTEHFEITLDTVRMLIANYGNVVAVGTTSVRTLESLPALGYRIIVSGIPDENKMVGQWEIYDIPEKYSGKMLLETLAGYMEKNDMQKIKAATCIMIMPGYSFRIVDCIITNFHQPQSTLLLLVSAFVGGNWRTIYDYALANGFRFLSYGDSSLLLP